jgi:hypothetical protein
VIGSYAGIQTGQNKFEENVVDATIASTEEWGTKDFTGNSAAGAMQSLSKLAYSSAYFCSYGVTYAAVFLANTLPSENAVMRGFADGARAAKDALEAK